MASVFPAPVQSRGEFPAGDARRAPGSRRTYTLRYDDDEHGIGKRVEFEAANAAYALEIARGEADGRWALLLEDGRPLCRLEKATPGDATFWIVAADAPPPDTDPEAFTERNN
jgi:hypothetical protein